MTNRDDFSVSTYLAYLNHYQLIIVLYDLDLTIWLMKMIKLIFLRLKFHLFSLSPSQNLERCIFTKRKKAGFLRKS